MGVMSCDRNGCNNIMCNLYSTEHGYICTDCYDELEDGTERSVKTFMKSIKNEYKFDDHDSWKEFLEKIFIKD